MTSYLRWSDVRADFVALAGGERAVEEGKRELLATIVEYRLAEVRPQRSGWILPGCATLVAEAKYAERQPLRES